MRKATPILILLASVSWASCELEGSGDGDATGDAHEIYEVYEVYETWDDAEVYPDITCSETSCGECPANQICHCGQCVCNGLSCGDPGVCCATGQGCYNGKCAWSEDSLEDTWNDVDASDVEVYPDIVCSDAPCGTCPKNEVCHCGQCVCNGLSCGDPGVCCGPGEGCIDGACKPVGGGTACVPSSFTFGASGGQGCLTIDPAKCTCTGSAGYADSCLFIVDVLEGYLGASPNPPWVIASTEPDVGSGAYVENLPLDTPIRFNLRNPGTGATLVIVGTWTSDGVLDLSIEC